MAALEQSSAKSKYKKKRSAPRIDMTPMVDLAFLLLTFFVMTTTLREQGEMLIKQPVADESGPTTPVNSEKVLNLVLGRDNKAYWYMGLPGSEAKPIDFSSSGIRKLFIQKRAEIKGLYVFIKASDQSRYQNLVDVLDEIIIAEVNNYAMLSLEAEDRELIEGVTP